MKGETRAPVSRTRATKFGKRLREDPDDREALGVAQQWRVQHFPATGVCFGGVVECAEQFENAVAVYRLKRMASIIKKLQRPERKFELGALDDIGGCRLIVETVDDVYAAAKWLNDRLEIKAIKDYVEKPQNSGYRSYHAIYKVPVNAVVYRIEVQIRTRLQHLWATAVEAVGEIYNIEYKSPHVRKGLRGEEALHDSFLRLASRLFADEEGTAAVPGTPESSDGVRDELRMLSERTSLLADLKVARNGVSVVCSNADAENYFLLCLVRELQFFDIVGYSHFEDAVDEYFKIENPELFGEQVQVGSEVSAVEPGFDNVVLVRAQSAEQVSDSYLNYTLGVGQFVDHVERLIGG